MESEAQILVEKILNEIKVLRIAKMEFWNLNDASLMLGYNEAYLYKLVSSGRIPHCKPTNGKVFFLKEDLLEWMRNHRGKTEAERSVETEKYLLKSRKFR
jgi:predicted DNA-binding transcriptional regulator AlpA